MFHAGDDKEHMFDNSTGPIPTIMKKCEENNNLSKEN